MHMNDTFAAIDPRWLDHVTGGATRSSNNQKLVTQMQAVTDALADIKRNEGNSSNDKMLPMMMAAMAMRNRHA